MYNKASEEKKWKTWKRKEEKILREYGVPEEKIKELHQYDWEMFNAERRFRQRHLTNVDVLEYIIQTTSLGSIKNFDDIMDQIDNEQIYQTIRTVNTQTMQILYLKICGYTTKEIAKMIDLSEDTVRYRIRSVRKKLKKF